jgi:transposase
LEERWQAGCQNTAALWRDLKERGFAGQYTVVRSWGTRRRRQDPPAQPKAAPRKRTPTAAPEPPTPRRAARLLTAAPETLDDGDRRFVAELRTLLPPVAIAADLIGRFAAMVKTKAAEALDGWLREAEASVLASFAGGIRRDEDAVRAALTEHWSVTVAGSAR